MALNLQLIISAVDRVTAPLNRMNEQVSRFARPFQELGGRMRQLSEASGLDRLAGRLGHVRERFGGVAREAGALGVKLAALGGGAGFLFKDQFIDTAAEFETYQATLETVMGSQDKAREAMDWVSDFAAKTPYEMGEVTDSFVKLKAYGIDPLKNGLLTTLGDTSSAMGKPLEQAVEAIADASLGQYERLNELGIKGSTKGNTSTFSYTDSAGKQQTKTVDKNNRQQIQDTLLTIWNGNYAGAMEKRSKTWSGMMSNLADQWTRFKLLVMKSGVFDWLKDKLGGFLQKIDEMAKNGQLKKWAEELAGKLKDGFNTAWEVMKEAGGKIKELGSGVVWLSDKVGGWKNLMLVVAGLLAGKLIIAIATFITALNGLGLTLLGTPIGWFIGIVALLAGAVLLVYKNWEPISLFFECCWDQVKSVFDQWPVLTAILLPFIAVPRLIYKHWGKITGFFNDLWDGIKATFNEFIGWITEKIDQLLALVDRMKQRIDGAVKAINAPINSAVEKLTDGESKSLGEWFFNATTPDEEEPWPAATPAPTGKPLGAVSGVKPRADVDLTGKMSIVVDVRNNTARVGFEAADKRFQQMMDAGMTMPTLSTGYTGSW